MTALDGAGAPMDAQAALERMSLIREFENKVQQLTEAGEVDGSVHLCLGQEAVPVGAVSSLMPIDRVIATYRGHGWALALGSDPLSMLAEILHRQSGLNGGRAGSALLSDPDHGFFGENSIVGAGVPIGAGLALASASMTSERVVVVSIGDGAMNQGSVTEGLVFAAARSLPLIVICEDNGWSEMTPTERVVRNRRYVSRAEALGIAAMEVDGNDPFAVATAVTEARLIARAGAGPVFIHCLTHRLSGHYNRDIQHYRSAADAALAVAADPIERLIRECAISDLVVRTTRAEISSVLALASAEALAAPRPDPMTALDHMPPDTGGAGSENWAHELRAPTPMTYQKAINVALRAELGTRGDLLLFGEDVGQPGGIFGVTRQLQKEFGESRVFDTPISESAIMGAALGASLEGVRTVVEIMWADFVFVALDQIVNQASNVRYINRSRLTAPMTIRIQQGATPGSCAQHSQSIESILAHIPGVSVGLPSSPDDAYEMTRAAIADPDPTVLLEHRALYQVSGDVRETEGAVPIGGARWRRNGASASIVTWGRMVDVALSAATFLESEHGVQVGVLDLRWLRPLDRAALGTAVKLGAGRVIVLHEAVGLAGFGAEVSSSITEASFKQLAVPVRRITAAESRIPASPVLQGAIVPDVADVVAAVLDQIRGSTP
jgi:2-oxoisovalerate dehydrogenase E1 component